MGELRQQLDDPAFPQITYRRGASGVPRPVIRGTGVHVQTVVVAIRQGELPPAKIAETYDLTMAQVHEAQAFYAAHPAEIDAALAAEAALDSEHE